MSWFTDLLFGESRSSFTPATTTDPNEQVYTFYDSDGNKIISNGDNGYVQEAVNNGIGIFIDDNGWHAMPYVTASNGTLTAHMPDWFKGTEEYNTWQSTVNSTISSSDLTDQSTVDMYNTVMSSLGSQAVVRQGLTETAKSYGITDETLQEKYVSDMLSAYGEMYGSGDASIDTLSSDGSTAMSVADIARGFQSLSKEDLASTMGTAYSWLSQGSDGTWTGSQEDLLQAAEQAAILNLVNDNADSFGEEGEFSGLLEASTWQKIQTGMAAAGANLLYNSIFGLLFRIPDAIADVIAGENVFLPNTFEEFSSTLYSDSTGVLGTSLEGADAAIQWGNFTGTVLNLAATAMMMSQVNGMVAAGSLPTPIGNVISKLNSWGSGGTIAKTLIYDFVVNDLPVDVMYLISDTISKGFDKALIDFDETQSLFGVPWIRFENGSLVNEYGIPNLSGVGPDVPAGFVFNVIGDLTIDFAPSVITKTLGVIDNYTGGYLARVKEAVAIKNFELQQKISKAPIIGNVVTKTVNFFVGTENANLIRAAKAAAIAEGSTDFYARVQNVLTWQNHGGAEAVNTRFKNLVKSLGVDNSVEYFGKNKNQYGGIQNVTVTWKEAVKGETKTNYKTIDDVLPIDVKNGLLDIQRLSELKGEAINEGELFTNTKRAEEIAELETRVEALPKEIKEFASQFHELNIEVNKMIENLGLTQKGVTEMWMQDPRFENYMVRQTLTRGFSVEGKVGAPDEANILTKARTDTYNRDTQVDPVTSLAMKVEAIGKAWAYNERAKFVAAMAQTTGHVVAGKSGAEAAAKLAEVDTQIRRTEAMRETLDYDTVLSTFSGDSRTISNAFKHINDLLDLPNTINAKSVYVASIDPNVKEFNADFRANKVSYTDNLAANNKLTDTELNDIMSNVYSFESTAKGDNFTSNGNGGGVTADGIPYLFTVKDGVVESLHKADTAKELAASVSGLSGDYSVSPETVSRLGEDNLYAINRTVLFYRDNLPTMAENVVFNQTPWDKGTYGFCYTIPETLKYNPATNQLEVAQFDVHVNSRYFYKGNTDTVLSSRRSDVEGGFHPKNSVDLSGTYIHENGHTTAKRLALLDFNKDLKEGNISISGNIKSQYGDYLHNMENSIVKSAMARMGITKDGNNQKLNDQRATISEYALSKGKPLAIKNSETIAEAVVDYAFNGQNASQFSRAIVTEITERLKPYATAAAPKVALVENGLATPKGLLKEDGTYNFPKFSKSSATSTETFTTTDTFSNTTGKLDVDTLVNRMKGWFDLDEWRARYFGNDETGDYEIIRREVEGEYADEIGKPVDDWEQSDIDAFDDLFDEAYYRVLDDMKTEAVQRIEDMSDNDILNTSTSSLLGDADRRFSSTTPWEERAAERIEEVAEDRLYDIARAYESDEIDVTINGSRQSEALYITFTNKDGEAFELRLADHDPTSNAWSTPDVDIRYDDYSTVGKALDAAYDEIADYLENNWGIAPREVKFTSETKTKTKTEAKTEAGWWLEDDSWISSSKYTTAEKEAMWLDRWRQENPYLKGKEFTEDQYKNANLWDSYFGQEISNRANIGTTAPDALLAKNADFLDNLNATASKQIVDEIKAASIKGVDEDLVTLALSRNYRDSSNALYDFVAKQINESAAKIAKKMEGGATEENLNKARMTLWSEDSVKNDVIEMLSGMVPGTNRNEITDSVNNLFETQAKGFAAIEALPVSTKELVAAQKKYQNQIVASNKTAKATGEKAAKESAKEYSGDVTQVIHYKEGGEDVYLAVDDPVVASVLRAPMDYKVHGTATELWNLTANFTARMYRTGTTGVNPLSWMRNVLRDPLQAAVTSGFNPLRIQLDPQEFYRSLRFFGLDDTTINTVMTRIREQASSGTLTREMRGYNFGVPGTRTYSNNIQKAANKLENLYNIKLIKKSEDILDSWEGFLRNQIGQQSFIRNYRRTGDVDAALGRALLETSNATTNFSHAVAGIKNITSTIPYLSSAINGTRSFAVLFNMDPAGMVTRITSGFMVPIMAITAWNLSDEDREAAYKNLPEWYKSTHIVLVGMDGSIFALPISDEISSYATLARNLIEYTNDASPYALNTIFARGVFGMLPVDTDGFFTTDGSIDFTQGFQQLVSGITPQLATTIIEFITSRDTYTGQQYDFGDDAIGWLNRAVLLGRNIFGTGFSQIANSIGILVGQPDAIVVGKSFAETLARDLFGVGFNEATSQFMEIIGEPSSVDENGKETSASGLFAENEKLQKQIQSLNTQITYASDEEKTELEAQKEQLISDFVDRVATQMDKYMQLYSATGGLEYWQKNKIVKVLTLGESWSSAESGSWEEDESSDAYLAEKELALQRYVDSGLPAGADMYALTTNSSGNIRNSIEVQAAINSLYGVTKQASADFETALENSNLKSLRSQYFDAIDAIYDNAEGREMTDEDYDMIERIQTRYLQAVDAVLVPILNEYGVNVLNNNDFIDTVKSYVNGFIPSNDWRQSTKNAKKYLSSKEYPLTQADTQEWLIERYSGELKDRGLSSDQTVTDQLNSIKADIDAGRSGAALGKIESLYRGVQQADYYISQTDLQTLLNYKNMLK